MAEDFHAGGRRLDSWKEIADYLGRDAATARRWEKTHGLPVRRVAGGRGRSVFAYTSEIDAWLRRGAADAGTEPPVKPEANSPADFPWRRAAVVGAIAIVAVVVASVRFRTLAMDTRDLTFRASSDGVFAVDAHGTERWRHPFPAAYKTVLYRLTPAVHVTSDGAGVLVSTSHRVRRADDAIESGQLLWFRRDGTLRRTYAFDDALAFTGKTFGEPWTITTFAIEPSSQPRTVVAAHHWEWSPSIVSILDTEFHRVARYVQAGWIEDARWIGGGRFIVTGFNEPRDGGMIALLDASRSDGQGPRWPDTPQYWCDECGREAPLRVVVLPRSEVNRATASRFNRALLDPSSNGLVVHTTEMPVEDGEPIDAVYEFTADLQLTRASYSQAYWKMHDALAARGVLSHDAAQCADRGGPRVVWVWEPTGGWRTVAIAAERRSRS